MRAIPLHPLPETEHDCPYCHKHLEILGWYIPGMRNLAHLRCSTCTNEFYGDLTAGQAIYTPMLLEEKSGVVHDKHAVKWFADWLRDSYANRKSEEISFVVDKRFPITRQVVLLNCLDTLYGHSLLKLLNAQYLLERNFDLIVIVPSFLTWMVPEGVAEIWSLDLSLRRGTEWNDWVAREIHTRVEALSSRVSLSLAVSHPSPKEYDIELFTHVKPFPLQRWKERLARPTVTFIWRDDRIWSMSAESPALNLVQKIRRRTSRSSDSLIMQKRRVIEFAELLRLEWPMLDFGIVGLGEVGADIPSWIQDLRCRTMDDGSEQRWCERYAKSHVVIGLHGSNMLLPTAHAGSLIELIGRERWGNFTQDVLFREAQDPREMFFRYRFMPISTTPQDLAELTTSMLRGYDPFQTLISAGH